MMYSNQASELCIGANCGDGVTGAPVIELRYKQRMPYLIRVMWRHMTELGWHRDKVSRPQDYTSWG